MMELARSAFPACRPLELPFRSLCTQQGPPFLCHAHAPLDVQDGRIQHVSAFWTKLRVSACATALAAAALVAAPTAAMASDTPLPSDSLPVLDLARVVPSGKVDALQQRLRSLEDDTGWRVRMLTRYGPSDTPTIEEIRKGWHVDGKTIVILVDPTAPNIM